MIDRGGPKWAGRVQFGSSSGYRQRVVGASGTRSKTIVVTITGLAAFLFAVWATVAVGGWVAGSGSSSSSGGIRAGGGLGTEAQDTRGATVPTETFETFEEGESTVAAAATGPLVVNFFAATCVPCVSEMPAFEEVHQKMRGQVSFLGLSVQESLESGRAIAERTGVTYPLGRDPDGSLLAGMGGIVMPTTALVDSNDRIVALHSGELTADELETLITEELLR